MEGNSENAAHYRHGIGLIGGNRRLSSVECSSWNYLAEDEEKEKSVYQLLHLLPDRIVVSLIKNTFAFDYHNDLEVKRSINGDGLDD